METGVGKFRFQSGDESGGESELEEAEGEVHEVSLSENLDEWISGVAVGHGVVGPKTDVVERGGNRQLGLFLIRAWFECKAAVEHPVDVSAVAFVDVADLLLPTGEYLLDEWMAGDGVHSV